LPVTSLVSACKACDDASAGPSPAYESGSCALSIKWQIAEFAEQDFVPSRSESGASMGFRSDRFGMVKGITLTRCIYGAAELDRLSNFFSALGLDAGRCREGSIRPGRRFAAPLGNLELVYALEGAHNELQGREEDECGEISIEVTSLDSVRQVVESWLIENTNDWPTPLSEIADSGWDSRHFTATPAPGLCVTFWEWSDPLRGKPLALEGDLSAEGMRFAIVAARWNAVITDRLLQGSLDALFRSGAGKADVKILRVPGAWEIPSAARALAETGDFDAIVTLGVLLRGETAHYEAIYNEVSRGIGQSQQETGIPHAFGVLTCETVEQALDRAGLKAGNKGFEAASAAIEMASLHRKIGKQFQKAGAASAPLVNDPLIRQMLADKRDKA
jgi:6,7-dimethyl-8-ribityllumazine synthase